MAGITAIFAEERRDGRTNVCIAQKAYIGVFGGYQVGKEKVIMEYGL